MMNELCKEVEPSRDQHKFDYFWNRSTNNVVLTGLHVVLKHLDPYARLLLIYLVLH